MDWSGFDRRGALSTFRRIFAFLVVANLPFWIAQRFSLPVPRGLFSLDYLLFGIAALYLPAALGLGLFALLFAIDVLSCSSAYYYFSQGDWIVAAESLAQLPATRVIYGSLEILLSGTALAVLCWAISGKPEAEARTRQALSLAFVFCILSAVSLVTGPFNLLARDTLISQKPTSSALYRTAHSIWLMVMNEDETPIRPIDSATHSMRALRDVSSAPAAHPHNLVLVVVESYGLLKDPAAAQLMQMPYHDSVIRTRFKVETGTTAFHGSTVPGEFRELCGLNVSLRSSSEAGQLAPQCLPQILEHKGYEATAFHGFTGRMFNRFEWYRDIGFEGRYFREQFEHQKICDGPFPGTCDSAVGELVRAQALNTSKPQFVYWLTLNSHLPVPSDKKTLNKFDCNQREASDEAFCVWRGLVEEVHEEVASIASDPRLPPTEFIVVGDHAPPFLSPKERALFSQSEVPYIHLIPHETRTRESVLNSRRVRSTHPSEPAQIKPTMVGPG